MSSLDDLFKKPALPSNKRKLEAARDPNEIYKSAKLSSSGHVKSNGKAPAVAEDEDDDVEAGPSAPSDDEKDYGPDIPDDDEGRFFGGGTTEKENEILDYMEGQEAAEIAPEKIDSAWLRKLALNFEKRISKNAELRAKFEGDPQKFMGSEADLDADIKALSILTEHPQLYGEFAKLGCVASLVGLLAHENTDIAIDVAEILSEMTDIDVEVKEDQWDQFVDAMLEADLLDLLLSNFGRLDEANESDRSGVYHALSLLDNLVSKGTLAEKIGQDTKLLEWLLSRIQKKESPVSQNMQYSAEVLSVLVLGSSTALRKLCELNSVDLLLQIVAAYRKRNPLIGSDEEEFVENIFDSLTCLVDVPEGKQKFVEAEGIELCLIMIREGKMSKPRALRLLDHALGRQSGAEACEKLVEAAGLKVLFGTFMKKQNGEAMEHLLGIFSSLLRLLPANSSGRIRTLAKFVEKDYEKLEKLVKLRRVYAAKVDAIEKEIRIEQFQMNAEEREEMADEWLERRMDAGLFCLQTIDVILAWLVAEDDGANTKIRSLLADRDEDLSAVKATIQEQLDIIDEYSEEQKWTKDMLIRLMKHADIIYL
ncbi:hypothetical protein LZ554_000473 [Drepanopeziza brunnea f. sp. 'monogermtubi']|nr:hypothetical protein LZ554_000473 [Drepanopeziza brunnea f. sp. 'monogermtubi']